MSINTNLHIIAVVQRFYTTPIKAKPAPRVTIVTVVHCGGNPAHIFKIPSGHTMRDAEIKAWLNDRSCPVDFVIDVTGEIELTKRQFKEVSK